MITNDEHFLSTIIYIFLVEAQSSFYRCLMELFTIFFYQVIFENIMFNIFNVINYEFVPCV